MSDPNNDFLLNTIDGLKVNNGNLYPPKDNHKAVISIHLLIGLGAIRNEISLKQMLKYLITRSELEDLIEHAYIEEINYVDVTPDAQAVIDEIKELKPFLNGVQVGNVLEGVDPIVVSGGQDFSTAFMDLYNPGRAGRRNPAFRQYQKYDRVASTLMLIGNTLTPLSVTFCIQQQFHSFTTEMDIYDQGFMAIMQIYYPESIPPEMNLSGVVLSCLLEAVQGTGCFAIPYVNCEDGIGGVVLP